MIRFMARMTSALIIHSLMALKNILLDQHSQTIFPLSDSEPFLKHPPHQAKASVEVIKPLKTESLLSNTLEVLHKMQSWTNTTKVTIR